MVMIIVILLTFYEHPYLQQQEKHVVISLSNWHAYQLSAGMTIRVTRFRVDDIGSVDENVLLIEIPHCEQ